MPTNHSSAPVHRRTVAVSRFPSPSKSPFSEPCSVHVGVPLVVVGSVVGPLVGTEVVPPVEVGAMVGAGADVGVEPSEAVGPTGPKEGGGTVVGGVVAGVPFPMPNARLSSHVVDPTAISTTRIVATVVRRERSR